MKHIDLRKKLYMDSLIQRKATGSPEYFARKLDLSRSAFFEYLAYMRYELMLLRINEALESLKNIPRNKLSIHFERVWQTKKKTIEPNSNLKENIKKIIDHGFYVTYMNFFKKGFSCKTSKINHAAISYNGDVYKCTGRNLTLNTREGILATDGHIKWKTEKHAERLAIETYNNAICKKCKSLPLCYDPCSQKYIKMRKSSKSIEDLCQLKMSEIPVDEHIMLKLRSALNIAKL